MRVKEIFNDFINKSAKKKEIMPFKPKERFIECPDKPLNIENTEACPGDWVFVDIDYVYQKTIFFNRQRLMTGIYIATVCGSCIPTKKGCSLGGGVGNKNLCGKFECGQSTRWRRGEGGVNTN